MSIAWAVIDGMGKVVREKYYLQKPTGEAYECTTRAQELHGLTVSMCRERGADPELIYGEFMKDIRECCVRQISGYNIARYDLLLLNSEMRRCGAVPLADIRALYDLQAADLYPGATQLNGGRKSKLGELYRHMCGADMPGAHNASVDVRMCVEIAPRISAQTCDPRPVRSIIARSIRSALEARPTTPLERAASEFESRADGESRMNEAIIASLVKFFIASPRNPNCPGTEYKWD